MNNKIIKVLSILIVLIFAAAVIGIIYSKKEKPEEDKKEDNKIIDNTEEYLLEDYHIIEDQEKSYTIRLDYNTLTLSVDMTILNNLNTENNKVIINNDELNKINKVKESLKSDNVNYKESIISALYAITKDKEVLDTSNNIESWEIYKENDINNDGTVTYREFGNYYLDSIIKANGL